MFERLTGGLVVSCQADEGTPLDDPATQSQMAVAAVMAGAIGIRANGASHISAIRTAVDVVIIGLRKNGRRGVYVTPTIEDAWDVIHAGADIVAVDATTRDRAGTTSAVMLRRFTGELPAPVLADVDSLDAARMAAGAGVDAISTTLSGYTEATLVPPTAPPDLDLVRSIAAEVSIPVIAEGRYSHPDDVRRAFDAGAAAVVVGRAITDPMWITRHFLSSLDGDRDD